MKRQFFWMLASILTLCGAAVFTSCSDSDGGGSQNPLGGKIIGTWYAETDGTDADEEIGEEVSCKLVQALEFNEDGTGSFYQFFVDEDNEVMELEDDVFGIGFNYTTQSDGAVKITMKKLIFGEPDTEEVESDWHYADGVLTLDIDDETRLAPATEPQKTQLHIWAMSRGWGAIITPSNPNDEDFTPETWRQQNAIYIYDGKGPETDSKGKKGYTLVPLPWSDLPVQSNLPNGFCDNITPENGWEWAYNLCGNSSLTNANFFAVYNKYTGILRFFYYMPENFSTGNDHVWQVTMTDGLAQMGLWGYGVPEGGAIKDKSKLAQTGQGTMSNYVTPWVDSKTDDGLVMPNAGWWAFDVDLSLRRPSVDLAKESIKLQMRSWETSHVSLYSTLAASIDGSLKQVVKEADSSGDIAKGVMTGLQAATSIASTIAYFKASEFGNAFGAIGSLFGCGSEFASIFGPGEQPLEAEISLGMKGTINTEGVITTSVPTVGVASPTIQLKDFDTKNTHVGQGVWNIKYTPEVYVFNDVKIDAYIKKEGSIIPEYYYAIPYFFAPTSVEFELNPDVFPEDQIEWVQCEASCVVSAGTGLTGNDKYRAAFGLASRNLGTMPNNPITKAFESNSLDWAMQQEGVSEIFNFMNYYSSWKENKTTYPVQVSTSGDRTQWTAKDIKGCGVEKSHAFEPALFIQRNWFTSKATDPVNIEMPPLEVNVTLLVKMKNMSQPIELSRNYLPQFYCYKRVEMDQWVRNAVNGYHDYGYPVNSYTRQYQKDRIQKLFDTILKF